jgi:hypothetical protein
MKKILLGASDSSSLHARDRKPLKTQYSTRKSESTAMVGVRDRGGGKEGSITGTVVSEVECGRLNEMETNSRF